MSFAKIFSSVLILQTYFLQESSIGDNANKCMAFMRYNNAKKKNSTKECHFFYNSFSSKIINHECKTLNIFQENFPTTVFQNMMIVLHFTHIQL